MMPDSYNSEAWVVKMQMRSRRVSCIPGTALGLCSETCVTFILLDALTEVLVLARTVAFTLLPHLDHHLPDLSCANGAQPARSIAEGWDLPQLGLRGLQNFLKLRTRHQFSDRLTADLGVDINALNQAIIPRAALSYQVCLLHFNPVWIESQSSTCSPVRVCGTTVEQACFRHSAAAGLTWPLGDSATNDRCAAALCANTIPWHAVLGQNTIASWQRLSGNQLARTC